MNPPKKLKTLILSDMHIGMRSAKIKEVSNFIRHNPAETLILNGDIIDGWKIAQSRELKDNEVALLKQIMDLALSKESHVIYLRGNHDDFLDRFVPFEINGIKVVHDYILESKDKRYYVVHGDIFDSITTGLKWLAKAGAVGYNFLLFINQYYNKYRAWRGLEYYSLSQTIKKKVKSAVSYISDFETQLIGVARAKKCDGIICGHIHSANDLMIDGIRYLNSGDWIESLTAITETQDGVLSIVHYADWAKRQALARTSESV